MQGMDERVEPELSEATAARIGSASLRQTVSSALRSPEATQRAR